VGARLGDLPSGNPLSQLCAISYRLLTVASRILRRGSKVPNAVVSTDGLHSWQVSFGLTRRRAATPLGLRRLPDRCPKVAPSSFLLRRAYGGQVATLG